MHREVHDQVREFVQTRLTNDPLRIADIGAYDVNGNLRSLFSRPGWTYTGFDLAAGPNVDAVLPSETEWPNVPSDNFDVVVSVSTLEHTRHPWLVMKEIARIVKPGGLVCLTAPYAWPYHAHPIDCWRIFPDGMQALMRSAGIEPLMTKMVPVTSDLSHGAWLGDTVGIGCRTR
jgi:SAM-dependent methyltransferase